MSHFSQSGRTEKGKWSPWPAACSPESQRSRPRSRSDRFIQNKEAAAGRQATGRMVDAYVGPVGHACMRCMDGPCRLHLTTQNARTRRGKRNSGTGGGKGSGRCGIALGADGRGGSSSSSNKARRPLNLHSPSAPGPARPSPADGSVPGAACRATSRPRRRPFRLRHGGTAPRSCLGVQSFRGVSSAGPWRRPWCAIHGPGSDRCFSLSGSSFSGVVVVQQQAWWSFRRCFCRCCCWCREWGSDVVVASAGGRQPWASSSVMGAGWRSFPPG